MKRTRTLIRILCLATAATLALPDFPWLRGPQILPALSPYVALGSVLARRSAVLVLPPVLLVLGLIMLRRRLLCRWVCPVGLINEQAGRLRRLFSRSRPANRTSSLNPQPSKHRRPPALPGRWIALLTLGGAAAGYPLVLWLDPFSIFTGTFGLLHKPLTLAALVPAIALGLIVLLSALWPGLWCVRLCPLGAMQEVVFIRRLGARASSPAPETSPLPAEAGITNGMPLARRALLGLGVGAAAGLGTRRLLAAAPPETRPILPPGAADRRAFNGLCIRCGNCVRACPSQIIKPSLGAEGLAALLTPELNFEQEYCHPDCVACTQVCPSGALGRLTVEAKVRAPIGVAVVRPDSCERAQGGDCAVCIMTCMLDAVRGPRPGEAEWGAAPVVVPERCTGCGACQLVCPAVPKAIVVEPLK